MVGRLLQNSAMYICMQQSIFIQLQHRIFSFNDYIHSTSTGALFLQQLYSFNFNTGYFCARRIFIQLQQKYFHSTKHIHSTIRKFPDLTSSVVLWDTLSCIHAGTLQQQLLFNDYALLQLDTSLSPCYRQNRWNKR